MYYEIHVVMKQHPREIEALKYAASLGWWSAKIEHDTSDEEEVGDVILTTRLANQFRCPIAIADLIKGLSDSLGTKFRRYKIEQAIVDSNDIDCLGLLT